MAYDDTILKMPEKIINIKRMPLVIATNGWDIGITFLRFLPVKRPKTTKKRKYCIMYHPESVWFVKMYMIIPESTIQNFFSIWLIRFIWMNKIKYYSFFCYVGLSWMPSFSCQDSTQYSWNVMDETSKYTSFVPLSVPSNSPNYRHDWPLLSILYGSSNPRIIKTWFCGDDNVTQPL